MYCFHHTDDSDITVSHYQLTGQQLSINHLRVIMEELNDVRAKWNNIGLQLGVSVGTLDAIKKQCNDHSDCLRETLTTWLKRYPPPPTWGYIIAALRSSTVDETKLASDLEQKYYSTQDISTTTTYLLGPPVPTMTLSQAHTWITPHPQFTGPISHPPFSYPVPTHSYHPPWSAPYCYTPPTIHPAYPHTYPVFPPFLYSGSLLPPSEAASTAVPPTLYSQVPPGPTLFSTSYLTTPMTSSPPYPVLPPPPPSLISDSTSPNTHSTPQPSTVTLSTEHTGM